MCHRSFFRIRFDRADYCFENRTHQSGVLEDSPGWNEHFRDFFHCPTVFRGTVADLSGSCDILYNLGRFSYVMCLVCRQPSVSGCHCYAAFSLVPARRRNFATTTSLEAPTHFLTVNTPRREWRDEYLQGESTAGAKEQQETHCDQRASTFTVGRDPFPGRLRRNPSGAASPYP